MNKVMRLNLNNPRRTRGLVGYAQVKGRSVLMRLLIWLFILMLLSILGLKAKKKVDTRLPYKIYEHAAQGGYRHDGRY